MILRVQNAFSSLSTPKCHQVVKSHMADFCQLLSNQIRSQPQKINNGKKPTIIQRRNLYQDHWYHHHQNATKQCNLHPWCQVSDVRHQEILPWNTNESIQIHENQVWHSSTNHHSEIKPWQVSTQRLRLHWDKKRNVQFEIDRCIVKLISGITPQTGWLH